MLVCASLNFRPPAIAPTRALPPSNPPTAAADAAGVVFGEHDRRRQDEVGRHHLAPADVRALAQLCPAAASARSCIMFCMPAPRSTTMKQFDC